MSNNTKLLAQVSDYYSSKIALHGETPEGVDWNGTGSQKLRFQQLCKIINPDKPFSLNDLGCGYGALNDYLVSRFNDYSYNGFDISEKMIESAETRFHNSSTARFTLSNTPDRVADYCIASGIFNVRLDTKDEEWLSYIKSTLDILDKTSRKGFAFNCLTSYSDSDKMRSYLYYADPCKLFDYCKCHFSRNVALAHDYDLYEFTTLVRK